MSLAADLCVWASLALGAMLAAALGGGRVYFTRYSFFSNACFLGVAGSAAARWRESPFNLALAVACAELAVASANWHLNSYSLNARVVQRDRAAMVGVALCALAQAVDVFWADARRTAGVAVALVCALCASNAVETLNQREGLALVDAPFVRTASFRLAVVAVAAVGVITAREARLVGAGGDWRRLAGLLLMAVPNPVAAVVAHAGCSMPAFFRMVDRYVSQGESAHDEAAVAPAAERHDATCGTFHVLMALVLVAAVNSAGDAGDPGLALALGATAFGAGLPSVLVLTSWGELSAARTLFWPCAVFFALALLGVAAAGVSFE